MIIATAGHVDHGKTSLIQAITGMNADRLPEEKSRGMSIDLGYAWWPQADGQITGFIDVPGHEKFLNNMLCGIGGIDHALLVVAADDGVMPQTQEHLAILQLSGQPALTVAVTKCDGVEPARQDAVAQQIRQLARQLGWENIALFTTSTLTGTGIAELSDHLRQLSARQHQQEQLFRLAIDRVFSVKGAGVVVTGTALSGEVRIGDSLWLTGMNKPVRVRNLHAQNQPTEFARAGQRIALNLSGGVEKEGVSRGDWLLTAAPEQPYERVIVSLQSHQPLHQGQPLHIHHGARHITGRISLLDDRLAELLLDSPLWLAGNDRLILRDISARQTLAGAKVLLLTSPKRGKRQPAFLNWLHQLEAATNSADRLELLLQRHPWHMEELNWFFQRSGSALIATLNDAKFIQAAGYLLLPQTALDWQSALLSTLENYHQQHSDRPGIGRDRLRRMAFPTQPAELVLAIIDRLIEQQKLINNHGWLHLPDFKISFDDREAAIWQQAAPLFAAEAWWVRDLANKVGCSEELMRQTLRKASQSGAITAIVNDRYYSHEQLARFAAIICDRAGDGEGTSAGDFRDRLGVGRKLAVQILEFFDNCGFTRRKGNEHLLRDGQMFR
ncbi:selenocysteine-specific translation elongation factor [Erwinia sorbitola]|uniref:Selenocysteine-specific elongation factor n=1 Tax=Erwinia sorbitola TaxID=2681984 RepID=A0A6I6EL26_9GAMM|nr:selenocysteine-specific translation elongation factor [Erwinia sorbitola]MTD28021.1 selenocysteine-specific translation elongation factor [Erwinia sorbitola]QGU85719.1 selenocysteine-specific translation elongation factor [Erwinia sorbitola]